MARVCYARAARERDTISLTTTPASPLRGAGWRSAMFLLVNVQNKDGVVSEELISTSHVVRIRPKGEGETWVQIDEGRRTIWLRVRESVRSLHLQAAVLGGQVMSGRAGMRAGARRSGYPVDLCVSFPKINKQESDLVIAPGQRSSPARAFRFPISVGRFPEAASRARRTRRFRRPPTRRSARPGRTALPRRAS